MGDTDALLDPEYIGWLGLDFWFVDIMIGPVLHHLVHTNMLVQQTITHSKTDMHVHLINAVTLL